MTIKITELPRGILALLGEDGVITVNAKHLVDIGEIAYDENGEPTNKVPDAFNQAMEDYYAG